MAVLLHTFPNGVRLVCEPMDGATSVAITVAFGSGSADETPAQAGLTHFCEHMIFKGTVRHTWGDIAMLSNLHGGALNAETSLDLIQLYARVVPSDAPEALGLMADMALESTFPAQEFERERGVILEEIAEYDDHPEDICYERLTSGLFGTHPIGRPIIGTADSVRAFSRDEAHEHWRRVAQPGNIVVSLAGRVALDECLAMTEAAFGPLSACDSVPARELCEPEGASRVVTENRRLEQVHFCFGTKGPNRSSEDRFPLYVLDAIFGGGMGSRLFTEVREKRGLAYSIGSAWSGYRETGVFSVGGSSARPSVVEVLDICRSEMDMLVSKGPTDREVAAAKRQLERSYLLAIERNSTRAGVNAAREIFGEPHASIEAHLAKINRVMPEDVQAVAQWLWGGDRRPTLSLVGPVSPRTLREAASVFDLDEALIQA